MLSGTRYCFDVEVFPNFFCCTFIRVDGKEKKTFIIWDGQDDKTKLLDFISKNLFLISFNGISYDLPVLRYIRTYKGKQLNADLFSLSSKLVSEKFRDDDLVKELRYWKGEEPFVHQDLMAMMNFFRTGVGLKQCSINLKWHRVQDLPFKYDYIVSSSDVDTIVDYNVNDTLITLELYNNDVVRDARELRESIANEYGISILSAAKSKMADIFFEKRYEEETGIPKGDFKKLRTPRPAVKLSDVILPEIKFITEKFNTLLAELKGTITYAYNEYKFEKSVFYKGNEFVLGVGGLHTKERPALYRESEDTEILSMDVSSFYPAIMCEYNIKPEHLTDKFIDILRNVKTERVKAKKAGDKTKSETYKIIVNATFGKLGFPKYWLYDPLAMLRVTVNGQLFLLMLIERMEEEGIRCISGNTDGCELLVEKGKVETAYRIAKEWQSETKFELEFANYTLLAKRDVNSYLAVDRSGKKKTKGAFNDKIDLEKGYLYPIVPAAVNEYLMHGTPVEETIYRCVSILDFCLSKKSREDFKIELKTLESTETLQKTNRFYVSVDGGGLQKVKESDGTITGIVAGRGVSILNNYNPNVPFSSYNVNKLWYIKQARSLLDKIENSQLDMFGFNFDFGNRKNFNGEVITKKRKKIETLSERVSLAEVKKAHDRTITYEVNPNFATVTDVNLKWSPKLKFYKLNCGVEVIYKIKKSVFDDFPLHVGDVVCLNHLEERPKYIKEDGKFIETDETEMWLNSYSLVRDVSDFKRKIYV